MGVLWSHFVYTSNSQQEVFYAPINSLLQRLPVVIIALLLTTDKFFTNCGCPDVLVDVVAANVNSMAAISISVSNAPKKWSPKFHLALQ